LEYFLFKKYTIYFTLLFAVIFSVLSFSALSFIFSNLDWFYYRDLEENLPNFIIRHFPFFWLFFSGVFITLSIYIWKNTERGYKYSGQFVFSALAIFVIIFGMLLNIFRMGNILDNQFAGPNFRPSFEERRLNAWDNPDKKRIIGTIVNVDNEKNIFTVEDRRFVWDIRISDVEEGGEFIATGTKIKMLCRSEMCKLLKFE
jgi:hypothetical protein